MKRAIIATIGSGLINKNTGKYERVSVYYNGEYIGEDEFVVRPLGKHLGADVYVIGIDTPETEKTINNYSIDKKKTFIVEDKIDLFRESLDSILKIVNKGYSEVYIDFTHGYRYLGNSLLFAAINTKVLLKEKIEIKLVYGKLDRNKKRTDYYNVKHYLDWLNESVEIVNSAEELNEKIFKKHPKDKKLEDLKVILFNLNLGNVHDEFIEFAKRWVKKKNKATDPLYILLELALKDKVREIIGRLEGSSISKRQLELSKIHLEKGNYSLSASLIREALASKAVELIDKKRVYEGECFREEELKKLMEREGDIRGEISKVRNALNHPLADEYKYKSLSQEIATKYNGKHHILDPRYNKIDKIVEKAEKIIDKHE